MKLEVGKSYRTRGGWRAKVVADDISGRYPVLAVHYIGMDAYEYRHSNEGIYSPNRNNYDLIAEWVDPPKPLECWVCISDKGAILAVSPEKFNDSSEHDCWARGWKIKHMREVFDGNEG